MNEYETRILAILANQNRFAGLIGELQERLFEELIAVYQDLSTSPARYDAFFTAFNRNFYYPVIQQLIDDVGEILQGNIDYFSGEVGVTAESATILKSVTKTLTATLGFTESGEIASHGFFNDILVDTGVQRDVRTFLQRQQNSDRLSSGQKQELRAYIEGNEQIEGIYSSYFQRPDKTGATLFDTYQKADRLAQNSFATKLGLQAAIYTGGIIAGTRDFCASRDGKIWLLPEIDSWADLKFSGKPAVAYDPRSDLGGYRCRHHLTFISNSTALRLDRTLRITKDGVLYRIK